MQKLGIIIPLICAAVVTLVLAPHVAEAWPAVFLRSRSSTGAYSVSSAEGSASAWQFDSTATTHEGPLATFERDGAPQAAIEQDGAVRLGAVATSDLRSGCSSGELVWDSTSARLKLCVDSTWLSLPQYASSGLQLVDGIVTCHAAGPAQTGCVTAAAQTIAGEKTFTDPITGNLTGNADTATALEKNGTDCNAGYYARGVSATGAAESCSPDLNTTYTAASPLELSGTQFQLSACADGEHLVYRGTAWACEPAGGQFIGVCKPSVSALAAPACETKSCSATGLTADHLILATLQEATDDLALVRAWADTDAVNLRFCSRRLDGSTTAQDPKVFWSAHNE